MMLEIKNVHKHFNGLDVLKGIDLNVEKGDVVAILGPSGSGKTTFLRCLNFLERADQGEIIFDGERFDLFETAFQRFQIADGKQVVRADPVPESDGIGVPDDLSDQFGHSAPFPVLGFP